MLDLIHSAITQRRRLTMIYAPGARLIEPHCLGYGSGRQLLLRAFQISGASASGEHINWKLFRIDRVDGLEGTDEMFEGARPEYNPDDRAMKGGIICRL
jgi:predicted DNA-binding transcriptional regulator YafY